MIPKIKLDDQTFDQIVESARKAIRQYAPEWTDENTHDPGITLIELFAWLTEMLNYYMDQTTDELLYTFMNLLGLKRSFGASASAICTIDNMISEVVLKRGMQFWQGDYCFEVAEDYRLAPNGLEHFYILDVNGNTLDMIEPFSHGISVAPFKMGNQMIWRFNTPLVTTQKASIYVTIDDEFQNQRNPITCPESFFPLGHIKWEAMSQSGDWIPIKAIEDTTFGLIQSGMISYDLKGLEIPHILAIRGTLLENDYDSPPMIKQLDMNTISVRQQETLKEPELLVYSGTGLPNQRLPLPFSDLDYDQLQVKVKASDDWEVWLFSDSLYNNVGTAKVYTIDPISAEIIFGDNEYGEAPKRGIENIQVSHLVRTKRHEGNIQLETLINEETGLVLNAITVSLGGRPMKLLEDMSAQFEKMQMDSEVAVTLKDYERIIKNAQGLIIEKVKCLPLFKVGLKDYPRTIADNEISIMVMAKGMSKLNKRYRQNIEHLINQHKLLTTEVNLIDPTYYEFTLHLEGESRYSNDEIKAYSAYIINQYDLFDFGKKIMISEIYKYLYEKMTRIDHLSLHCKQSVEKDGRGDIALPPHGIGILVNCEIHLD